MNRLSFSEQFELIDSSKLSLFHQPIVPLRQQFEPKRVELLLRLNVGEERFISAAGLIERAEQGGFIFLIDCWVVAQALAYLARQELPIVIHINLSAATIQPRFLDFLMRQLAESDVNPHRIVFELTETLLVNPGHDTLHFFQTLRSLGCRLALDDFGAGALHFGLLQKLKPDLVKLPGQFVQTAVQERYAQQVVRSLVKICQTIETPCVAEWVEDQATLELLWDLGVDYGQGYLLGRPEPLLERVAAVA